jgi:hypothetical protein
MDKNWVFHNDDYDRFVLKLTMRKGAIPNIGLSGFLSYERAAFVSTLMGSAESDDLFDANTVIRAQVVYSVTPDVDVVLLYTTMARRDSSGTVQYSSDTFLPEMDAVMLIGADVRL